MGTERRQQQKQRHAEQIAFQRSQQRKSATSQKLLTVLGSVAVIAAVLGVIYLISDRSSTTAADTANGAADQATSTTAPGETTTTSTTAPDSTKAATLVAPPAGASITGETKCPPSDGSAKRTTSFESAPPMCIDESKTYLATFETSKGSFVATLDPKEAPIGVNNFVVLARYKFYDGIPFHRIAADFVIQAGDPAGAPWGTHGPGYTISEEPPSDMKYEKYDLAMAKTQEANSTGSQFFISTGSTDPLNSTPTYTVLGSITEGRDVVDKIGAISSISDAPTEAVVIKSVTISEQ